MVCRLPHAPRRGFSGLVVSAAALLFCTANVHAGYVSTVFATDLNNPRGLAFGPDRALYIAEAGISGDESGKFTEVRGQRNYYTETGSVTRVSNGVQTRVQTGLPSLWGADVSGPNDVSFDASGARYVTLGAGIDPRVRGTDLGPDGVKLGRLDSPGRSIDVAAHEASKNPAGGPLDSNPWRSVAIAGGVLVTDAGANALLKVADDGSITTVTTFDRLPWGNGLFTDPVPTGLALGADGAYYVGMLTGFPFTPGSSQVFRVTADGSKSVYADGFTNVTDLAFGIDGSLYVLEHDANGMQVLGDDGALIRIGPDGSQTTIFSDGLLSPTGLTIGEDGAFYVSSLDPSGAGQVVRIALVPEPATLALLALGLALTVGTRRRRPPRGTALSER